jgi:hypothetical protein
MLARRLRKPNNMTRLASEPAQRGAAPSPGIHGADLLNALVVATSVAIVSAVVTAVFEPFAVSEVGLKVQVV